MAYRLLENALPIRLAMNHTEGIKVTKMSVHYQTKFDQENGISPIVETLGGSNVTQIFVHGITSLGNVAELEATLPGFEKYPER